MTRSAFCKLSDPATYVACDWNLVEDAEGRVYWIEMFKRHFKTLLRLGLDVSTARGEATDAAEERTKRCRAHFDAIFDDFAANPRRQPRVTILTLDEWRDQTLRKFGFDDPFVDLKDRENDLAILLLRRVCEAIDAILDERDQIRAVIEGVFAGNIFDMGAEETARKIMEGKLDFFHTRESLPKRPWLVDQYDALESALLTRRYRKAVFFVDNAGADFMLGVVPLTRWLARRETHVVLVGNELPALNDMTVGDLRKWWTRVCEMEPTLIGLPISIVTSGTGEPLIDLSQVSDELNLAATDADLVIIEGMGRGVESNLNASFTCDAVNLAMIKDPMVAKYNQGKLYDVVCRFR